MLKMTKAQFLVHLKQDIERFRRYVDECNAKNPQATIHELSPSDWFEQFILFCEDDWNQSTNKEEAE